MKDYVTSSFSVQYVHSKLTSNQYYTLYQESIYNPNQFWERFARQYISWYKAWDHVLVGSFTKLDQKWFSGAMLNVTFNCIDRHLEKQANKIALLWESNTGEEQRQYTYQQLHDEVCQFANALKTLGVEKGDCVCIYLPMIPEAVIAMLACARIGAVHSVVFAGFSPEALKTRIIDAQCCVLITADISIRGDKLIPLKSNVDQALLDCPEVKQVIVVQHTSNELPLVEKRDVWYHELIQHADMDCEPEILAANDPLFILYTSGSTGKPKGILHGCAGYLLHATMSFDLIFDYQLDDIFWCTADVGWITGHSYVVYGPLSMGATILLFEGTPHYPTPARFWEIIDKYQVSVFYTAPTAIRALRQEGDEWVTKTKRSSLRLLGTVGEPINPEAWRWYYQIVGDSRCPIVDTWWQTETGGIAISPLPGLSMIKPGAASQPFFGIQAKIVNDDGSECKIGQLGNLVITQPWPGMMLTVYKNYQRFLDTYFKPIPGYYFTGDEAYCDQDGYFWIAGRCDDLLNVSGHRIGTAEVESAFLKHEAVSEAAIVGIHDDIKGEAIYAFVTLKAEFTCNDNLKKELIQVVRKTVGAFAAPKYIQWASALPKTRSGKIMRRILRKIAKNQFDDLGDLSTLADPDLVRELVKNR